ncbi:MAG: SdiA-regulated domain-containing protein [Agriterribacter sp.]
MMFPFHKSIVVLIYVCLAGCVSGSPDIPTPPHYRLDEPEKFLMPESLLEISGIAFHHGKSDTVYAIQDEEGKLFRLAWREKKQTHIKFGKKGDYEDVTILHDEAIVLKSNGALYFFPLGDEDIDSTKESKHIFPQGEYEGLYADEQSGNIYVLCKNCMADNSKASVTGYILQQKDSLQQTGSFSIDVSAIKDITGKVKRGFRPSGLAQQPLTKEWFIISAVNKLLVITDSNWQVKEVYPLDGKIFNQPEGIAFDNAGNLYISNEGDDLVQGNILKFARQEK